MTTISDKDRAEAQAMLEAHNGCGTLPAMSDSNVRRWLTVRDHVLAAHECPDVESDARVQAWNEIAQHPFFTDCYQTEGTLVDAMLAKLDTAHECPTVPVWRPTTRDEIQPGWEVRARRPDGSEATWGVAHHRDDDGDWRTKASTALTHAHAGWTCETTAPLPEPEPWDEALVGVVSGALAGTEGPAHHWDDDARRVLDALAARGYYLERAAITGGEQA